MLGIGFIITHFVAMQKPQQRKYHSSCDRSVHRGTAHGKQRVKVCKRKTPHLFLMRSFLSPYGDGTVFQNIQALSGSVFAPLRGWYLVRPVHLYRLRVFAPLRGWYIYLSKKQKEVLVFAPLTRMVLQSPQTSRTPWSFRPLAGIVQYSTTMKQWRGGFRPLTGMVRLRRNIQSWTMRFRPLAGIS